MRILWCNQFTILHERVLLASAHCRACLGMTVVWEAIKFTRIVRPSYLPSTRLVTVYLNAQRPSSPGRRPIHSQTTRGTHSAASLPLAGVRVLEVGQVIAGPFCGQLLGY